MAKQLRLSQVIAVEKQVKAQMASEGMLLLRHSNSQDLFNGLTRTYERKDEEGEELPSEQKLVQQRASTNLDLFAKFWRELLDAVATKDWGNLHAKAQVVVDGEVLISDAPVTYLIWLEKQLDDLRNFVDKLPVLDPSKVWRYDTSTGLSVTEAVRTARHKKVPRVLLKVEATEHHPAQAEIIHDDILVGYWSNVSTSGALPEPRRRQLLERIDALRKAVKEAREEANSIKIDHVKVGTTITQWLLKEKP